MRRGTGVGSGLDSASSLRVSGKNVSGRDGGVDVCATPETQVRDLDDVCVRDSSRNCGNRARSPTGKENFFGED